MWKIKDLKKNARGVLKRNYFSIIITCVLIMIVMGNFINPVSVIQEAKNEFLTFLEGTILFDEDDDIDDVVMAEGARQDITTNTEIVNSLLGGAGVENEAEKRWTKGVLAVFASNTEGAGDVLFGILNSVNQMAFHDKIGPGIIIAIGTLISFLFAVLFKRVLLVGFYRYLLENRVYKKTKLMRILFPWSVKQGLRVAWIMFVRRVYILLWGFTIVGGIIKSYSYRLVPVIIAENPDMSANEAITLSRQMMNGNKWKVFLLDLSFIGWFILNICTFHILDIFFLNPYKNLTDIELYMNLRAEAKAKNIQNADKLCDSMLDCEVTDGQYPDDKYIIAIPKSRKWIQADYNRSYSITSLILIFFVFSFVGWLWEVSLHLFKDGVFVNRGVSYGPWLPIYGTGGVSVLVALKKLRNKPAVTFVATMVLCGIVEYFTSLFLEMTKGMKWWDYSGYFMNLNGRICLEGLLIFAIAGCAAIYLIAPTLDNLFKKIPRKYKITICAVLIAVFLADQTYAHFVPNTGKGITDYK
ncbi:MAG: DUF975 family protein [Hominilimicola sp.]